MLQVTRPFVWQQDWEGGSVTIAQADVACFQGLYRHIQYGVLEWRLSSTLQLSSSCGGTGIGRHGGCRKTYVSSHARVSRFDAELLWACPVMLIMLACPGGPLLAALVSGDAAVKFEKQSPDAIVARVLGVLERIFKPRGIRVPQPLQVCWQAYIHLGAHVFER